MRAGEYWFFYRIWIYSKSQISNIHIRISNICRQIFEYPNIFEYPPYTDSNKAISSHLLIFNHILCVIILINGNLSTISGPDQPRTWQSRECWYTQSPDGDRQRRAASHAQGHITWFFELLNFLNATDVWNSVWKRLSILDQNK